MTGKSQKIKFAGIDVIRCCSVEQLMCVTEYNSDKVLTSKTIKMIIADISKHGCWGKHSRETNEIIIWFDKHIINTDTLISLLAKQRMFLSTGRGDVAPGRVAEAVFTNTNLFDTIINWQRKEELVGDKFGEFAAWAYNVAKELWESQEFVEQSAASEALLGLCAGAQAVD